ncbi:MAG: hypothetical protein IKK51_01540 [Oscillospiraceae bacterium]|nr:hypothetical protein [Oscillospiraceae bacterium]
MEETIIEIPNDTQEDGWQPPVLTHVISDKKPEIQRLTDVFFIQYVVCILLVLAVFILRFCDKTLGNNVLMHFDTQSHVPTAACIAQFIEFLQSIWS